jgi:hypothetical protein
MELVSARVSVERNADLLSVVIAPRLSRMQEALLVAWNLAWLLCGAIIFVELLRMPSGSPRSFVIAFLAFWVWFAIRIGRVMLWRLKGFELLRVKDGRLTIKDSILGYGRANDYFIENIQRFGALAIDESTWTWQLNDSFWVMGAERLGFEHLGRKVVFGKGLTQEESQRLATILEAALRKARRSAVQ